MSAAMKNLLWVVCWMSGMLWAQDAPRQIWDGGFLQKRPSAARSSRPRVQPPIEYKTTAPAEEQKRATQPVIGMTLWKLRVAEAHDDNTPRLLLQDSSSDVPPRQFVPERIDLSQPLHDGERVRVSIESPRAGFLYVIDRERYSDGSVGDPVLIFPARNFSFGVNDVEPGRVVEIPPQDSRIPALKVNRSSERHVGEELLIVVTKDRIPDLTIEDRETKLAPELVSRWEKDWGVTPMRLDLSSTTHSAWTSLERDAGERRYLLTQDDPMPATIFSVSPAEDKPLLLHIPLRVQNR